MRVVTVCLEDSSGKMVWLPIYFHPSEENIAYVWALLLKHLSKIDPKTNVSNGVATPAPLETGTEMHNEGRKGTALQEWRAEIMGVSKAQ